MNGMESKIIEVSVGLGAAAIIIDKVLAWTLKWRSPRNGGKCPPRCVDNKEVILALAASQAMADSMKKQQDEMIAQTALLTNMKEGGDRREKLLSDLLSSAKNGWK